jgi:biopolymer transport protein ExbB/TolQ
MGNLIIYGFIALSVGFFSVFCTSLYAIARLRKFQRSVSDLDWDSLADLTIDVQKLKKNAQKYQANVNAAQKLTQKEKMQLAIEEAQYAQRVPVTNIIGMER